MMVSHSSRRSRKRAANGQLKTDKSLSPFEQVPADALLKILQFLQDTRASTKVAACSKTLQRLVYKDCTPLWEHIDLTNEFDLTDRQLARFLERVNAKDNTKSLILFGCHSFVGTTGLEPLRASLVLERVDLRRFTSLDEESVISVLETMISYHLVQVKFPTLFRSSRSQTQNVNDETDSDAQEEESINGGNGDDEEDTNQEADHENEDSAMEEEREEEDEEGEEEEVDNDSSVEDDQEQAVDAGGNSTSNSHYSSAVQSFLDKLRGNMWARAMEQSTICHGCKSAFSYDMENPHASNFMDLKETSCDSCHNHFCGQDTCAVKLEDCHVCLSTSCAGCSEFKECNECELVFCSDCRSVQHCDKCDQNLCSSCTIAVETCDLCGESCCRNCVPDGAPCCNDCGIRYCGSCRVVHFCKATGNTDCKVCKNSIKTCDDCGELYCDDCAAIKNCCQRPLCGACMSSQPRKCHGCSASGCVRCVYYGECGGCEKSFCKKCYQNEVQYTTACTSCFGSSPTCKKCRQARVIDCVHCGRPVCKRCVEDGCEQCKRPFCCAYCRKDGAICWHCERPKLAGPEQCGNCSTVMSLEELKNANGIGFCKDCKLNFCGNCGHFVSGCWQCRKPSCQFCRLGGFLCVTCDESAAAFLASKKEC